MTPSMGGIFDRLIIVAIVDLTVMRSFILPSYISNDGTFQRNNDVAAAAADDDNDDNK